MIIFKSFFLSQGHSAAVAGVEVENHELGLLGAVAGAHGADQLGGVGSDAPDDAAGATAFQGDQISNELACLNIPQLDRSII